jgi:hypothetical protein
MRYNKLIATLFLAGISIAANSQTIRGRMLFTDPAKNPKVPAKEIQVLLAPQTPANDKIVSADIFMWDNADIIQKMNASITTTNDDGYYYFAKVPPGKYIVRVCRHAGIVYRFALNVAKNKYYLLPELRAMH